MITLMYHDVVPAGEEDTSGFSGRDAAIYKVTPALFDAHLRAIQRSLPDPREVTFTFDDGGTAAAGAADALERYGLRGMFFMTVDYIGRRGFLDRDGLRDLRRRGHQVGSHSCSHPLRMGHLSPSRLRDEWTMSRAALSDILGEEILAASVPGGDFSPAVATTAADAGYTRLFTSEPIVTDRQLGSMTIAGRFTIQRWTSARAAAALAGGRFLPRTRQLALWNMKKLGKQIGGGRYLQLRRALLGHDPDVRWGDRGQSTK
jgi:peptidoglycan/xylan/chitin deacetylase (PgdA/CDA1 family)